MKSEKKPAKSIPFSVTKEGSLGLLAYGDLGLTAWRKVKSGYTEKSSDE